MENLRISGDDDSTEASRGRGRSLGRGRGTRPTNQSTLPNVGAPSQPREVQQNSTREPTRQTSARDIQLQNQFQREVGEEELLRARIEARIRGNQNRLTTQIQREQDEASASARYPYRSQTDDQFQSSGAHMPLTGAGASSTRDEMDERKQAQDKAEKEKFNERGMKLNLQQAMKEALTSKSAKAMTTNEKTTQARQDFPVPMSARNTQLQNQYHREFREDERQRARLEAHTAAQQERLNAQFQRELAEEQRNAARSHTTQTGTLPKTGSPAGVITNSSTIHGPAPHQQSARDIQIQNQYLQALEEDQRQRAQAAQWRAVQQERLNAQFYRELAEQRAEEQRNAARWHRQQAATVRNQRMFDSENLHLTGREPRMTQDRPSSQEILIQSQNTASGGLPAARWSEATIRPHVAITMVHTPHQNEQRVLQCPIPIATVMQPMMYSPTGFCSHMTQSVHPTLCNIPHFQEVDDDDPLVERIEYAGGWGVATVHHVNPSASVGRVVSNDEDDANLWPEDTENEERGRETSDIPRMDSPFQTTREYMPAGAEGREDYLRMFRRGGVLPSLLAESVHQINAGASDPVEEDWPDEESQASTEEETAGDSEPVEQGSLGMCLVCLHRRRSTVFLDCGHIACCRKCSSFLRKCPTCRAVILKVQRAYLP
ncbi:hypothetical protein B566_EDAN010566 [Ephemera danica]|nr:hypothetical protein B566_EDAN010566 [Ephemera danica]